MDNRYDVFLNLPGGIDRLGSNVSLREAREIAKNYFDETYYEGNELEIVLADGSGYGWQTTIGDRVLGENLSYYEAINYMLYLTGINKGHFLNDEQTQFKIEEPGEYFNMVFSIRNGK